jgi:hypothetical protein
MLTGHGGSDAVAGQRRTRLVLGKGTGEWYCWNRMAVDFIKK